MTAHMRCSDAGRGRQAGAGLGTHQLRRRRLPGRCHAAGTAAQEGTAAVFTQSARLICGKTLSLEHACMPQDMAALHTISPTQAAQGSMRGAGSACETGELSGRSSVPPAAQASPSWSAHHQTSAVDVMQETGSLIEMYATGSGSLLSSMGSTDSGPCKPHFAGSPHCCDR